MFNVLDHRDEPSGLVFHVNHISGTNRIAVAATGALIEVDINYHWLPKGGGIECWVPNEPTALLYHVRPK